MRQRENSLKIHAQFSFATMNRGVPRLLSFHIFSQCQEDYFRKGFFFFSLSSFFLIYYVSLRFISCYNATSISFLASVICEHYGVFEETIIFLFLAESRNATCLSTYYRQKKMIQVSSPIFLVYRHSGLLETMNNNNHKIVLQKKFITELNH